MTDNSTSARSAVVPAVAFVATALAAAAGQWCFARGHALLGGQYEELVAWRTAGLVAYALAAIGAAVLCARTRGWRGVAPRRSAALLLVLLVVVAAALRGHRLRELPPGLWIDEALNGVQAIDIARRGWPRVALPPEDVRTGLGAGFVDLAALVYAFGDPDDGPLAIRAVAAGLGTLGVAAAAALAWAWFGPLAAVAATAWLAVSQWHLNYSRWGRCRSCRRSWRRWSHSASPSACAPPAGARGRDGSSPGEGSAPASTPTRPFASGRRLRWRPARSRRGGAATRYAGVGLGSPPGSGWRR
ncbi:MAG: hypothetical protein U0802_11220 [Candidatus Binatia bacterium]